MAKQTPSPRERPVLLAWLIGLTLLPLWLGLPLLLALVAVRLLHGQSLLTRHQRQLRRALSWGLPGVLFSLQRGLQGAIAGLGRGLAWRVDRLHLAGG